ncbi:hypothetical protein [Tunturiibacter gelidiferens]|uniref:hypothetical protein n=1 Tax=Tunturiibacter gelidiferens TaxID=3069689 RepID=UPI003D9B8335
MAQTEQLRKNLTQPGILAALGAVLLFGSGTPLAKLLLADVSPWLMAALLYLGSGIGLTQYRLLRRSPAVRLPRGNGLGLPEPSSPEVFSVLAYRCLD